MLDRLLPSSEVWKESLGVGIRQYAVVTDGTGRLLVLQFPAHYKSDARNCWTLPGGGLFGKENPRAGMVRELGEETGLRPDLGLRVRVDRTRRLKDGLWVCYRGVESDTVVRLSREHQAYAWVTEEELRSLVFYHGSPIMIRASPLPPSILDLPWKVRPQQKPGAGRAAIFLRAHQHRKHRRGSRP